MSMVMDLPLKPLPVSHPLKLVFTIPSHSFSILYVVVFKFDVLSYGILLRKSAYGRNHCFKEGRGGEMQRVETFPHILE